MERVMPKFEPLTSGDVTSKAIGPKLQANYTKLQEKQDSGKSLVDDKDAVDYMTLLLARYQAVSTLSKSTDPKQMKGVLEAGKILPALKEHIGNVILATCSSADTVIRNLQKVDYTKEESENAAKVIEQAGDRRDDEDCDEDVKRVL
jgi:hypothetical protein